MENRQKTPVVLYVLSAFCFIPLIGVFIGAILILFSVFSKYRDKILIIIATCGILSSVILYGSLYYYGSKHGGSFDELTIQLAETELTNIVKELEYYKLQHDRYPDSLTYINSNNSFLYLNDPIQQKNNNRDKNVNFYYELRDSGYYLFSVGYDGIPFTDDDILPKVSCDEAKKIGILKCKLDSTKTK